MDTVLFNAMKRREEIRQELSEIERFLRMYNRFNNPSPPRQPALFTDRSEAEQGIEQSESTLAQAEDVSAVSARSSPRRGLSREELKPHIFAVIRDAGRPLTRSQLLKALDDRQTPVGGTNRSKNLGTIMWRLSGDFVSLSGFGYWPRNLAYEPAGYDPSDDNSPEAIDYTLREREPEGNSDDESER